MPNTKTATKELRKNVRRRARNLKTMRQAKNSLKAVRKLLEGKQPQEAEAKLPEAYKALDKAAKKGVMKPNAASRAKSRLTRRVQAAK